MHFLTITHTPEIPILRLQARSMARFLDASCTASIMVICNESDFISFHERFKLEVLSEYGELRTKVSVLHRSALAQPKNWGHGWRSQQLLKLLAIRYLGDGIVLVLDSKNHFVSPITEASYQTNDGRLRTWKTHHIGHMERNFRASVSAFGIDADSVIHAWPPSITPFPVRAADVRECLDVVTQASADRFFEEFLQQRCLMTEFFLITAYQKQKYGDLAVPYEFGQLLSATLFRDKVVDPKKFESLMFIAYRPSTLSFAIHHGAFAVLDEQQRRRISDLWLARGLIASSEQAESFLVAPYGRYGQ